MAVRYSTSATASSLTDKPATGSPPARPTRVILAKAPSPCGGFCHCGIGLLFAPVRCGGDGSTQAHSPRRCPSPPHPYIRCWAETWLNNIQSSRSLLNYGIRSRSVGASGWALTVARSRGSSRSCSACTSSATNFARSPFCRSTCGQGLFGSA